MLNQILLFESYLITNRKKNASDCVIQANLLQLCNWEQYSMEHQFYSIIKSIDNDSIPRYNFL